MSSTRRATVVGAGIAGATVAWLLAGRGWQVRVLEAGPAPGQGGSGNPAAILYPKLVGPALTPVHLQSLSWLMALDILRDPALSSEVDAHGVLWLDHPRQGHEDIGSDHPWWGRHVWRVDAAEASRLAGVSLDRGGLWLPEAGTVRPQGLLRALLGRPGVELVTNCEVQDAVPADNGWQLRTTRGEQSAEIVILAQAGAATRLAAGAGLPLRPVRGQISQVSTTPALDGLRVTLCHGGYLTPAREGRHVIGATFQPGRDDHEVLTEDHAANRAQLAAILPDLAASLPPEDGWDGRASLRWQTPDYLPLVGRLPWLPALKARLADVVPGRRLPGNDDLPALMTTLGHGSKGFTQAWLAAAILVAQLHDEAPPCPAELVERLRPERFLLRDWKRGLLRSGR